VELLRYGFLGFPLAFGALPLYVQLPQLYAHAGLPVALIGLILLGGRLFDAFTDPWLGSLSDRLTPWRLLRWAMPLFVLGFAALMLPPARGTSLWLLLCLVTASLGYSAASIAHQALLAESAADSQARTRLTATREAMGLCGVILACLLPSFAEAAGLSAGLALSLGLAATAAIAMRLLIGVARATAPSASAADWLVDQAFWAVLQEPKLRRLLMVFALNGIAAAIPASLFLFFVADVLRAASFSGGLLALYFMAGAASIPAWTGLAARLGRTRAWWLAMLLSVVAFAGAGFLGPGDEEMFALICLLSGACLGADLCLPSALAADLGHALQRPGSVFGLWNLVSKLNLAVAAGCALPILGLAGYEPGRADGVAALALAYSLFPLLFKAGAAWLLWRWRAHLEVST